MLLNLPDKHQECSEEEYLGFAPASYFFIGVIEITFSILLTSLIFKRNCIPKFNQQTVFTYILPIYLSIVISLMFITFLMGVDSILGFLITSKYLLIGKWFILRGLSESLSIFFMHPGIGIYSARRSLLAGFLWSFIHSVIGVLFYIFGGLNHLVLVAICALVELIVFYLTVFFSPIRWLSRRPAIYSFSIFNLLIIAYQLVSASVYIAGEDSSSNSCSIEICFSLTEFFIIINLINAFIQDSKFWQGLYSSSKVNLNEPVLGVWDLDRDAVNTVTESVMQLERKIVPIIPFSQLQVDTSLFFSGGTARVYRGNYQRNEVAIKFLFSLELTPDRIVEFCNEAALLHSLKHPNIVECHGVAIMPPAISLVTEFCTYGSLFDFLHSTDFIQEKNGRVGNRSRTGTADTKLSNSEHGKNAAPNQINSTEYKSSLRFSRTPLTKKLLVNVGSKDSYDSQNNSLQFQKDLESGSNLFDNSLTGEIESTTIRPTSNIIIRNIRNPQLTREESMSNDMNRSYEINEYSDEAKKLAEVLGDNISTASPVTISYRIGSIDSGRSSFRDSFRKTLSIQMPWKGASNSRKFSNDVHSTFINQGSVRLKSPASVMMTREMGFGLGPNLAKGGLASLRIGEHSHSRNLSESRSRLLLSCVHSSIQSIGNLLPFPVRLNMIRDCCAGLAFLHEKGFMHCDIKSLNFLVTSSLVVKLADLGEARPCIEFGENSKRFPSNINWSSPETLNFSTQNLVNRSADVWSLVMVFYEILSGEVPFDSPEHRAMTLDVFLDKLEKGSRPELPSEVLPISWLNSIIENGWSFDPKERMKASSMLEIIDKNIFRF